MIVDLLSRLSMYGPISPRLSAAARWAAETDLHALPLGKQPIDTDVQVDASADVVRKVVIKGQVEP